MIQFRCECEAGLLFKEDNACKESKNEVMTVENKTQKKLFFFLNIHEVVVKQFDIIVRK